MSGPVTPRGAVPGEVLPVDDVITLNPSRDRLQLIVDNSGDRPIQVGSHYSFDQVNPALSFDRAAARGRRLDIPAGTSVRFEPGVALRVWLVPLAGAQVVPGLRGDG